MNARRRFGLRRLDAAFLQPGVMGRRVKNGASSRAMSERRQAAALQVWRGVALLCLLLAAPGWAGTLTWDPDGMPGPETGGSGSWTDPGVWFDGTNHVSWADGSDAVLGGTNGSVLLTNNVIVGDFRVDTPGYILDVADSSPTLTVTGFTGSENLQFDSSGTNVRRTLTISAAGRVPFLADYNQTGVGLTAAFGGGTLVLERPTAFTSCYSLTVGSGEVLLNSPSILQAMHMNINDGGVLGGTGAVSALKAPIGKQLALRPGGVLTPGDPEIDGGIGRLTLSIGVECYRGTNALGMPATFRVQLASPTSYDQLVLIGTNAAPGGREVFDCDIGGASPNPPVIDVQIATNFSGGAVGDFLCLIDNQTLGNLNVIGHTFANAPNFAFFGFTNAVGTPYFFQYRYNVDKDDPLQSGNDFGLSIARIGSTNAPVEMPRDLPADTLVWDADGPGAEFGGSGAWTDHWAWWDGNAFTTWTDGKNAVFGGTAGTVALENVNRSIGTLQVDSPGYVLSATNYVSSGNMLAVSNFVGSTNMTITDGSTIAVSVNMTGLTSRLSYSGDFTNLYRMAVKLHGPTMVFDRPSAYSTDPWYTFFVVSGTCLWNTAHIPFDRIVCGNGTLGNGAVIGGTGSVDAVVPLTGDGFRVNPGAALAPGDPAVNGGVGTLTLGHYLRFQRGPSPDTVSVFRVEIAGPTAYDKVVVLGTNSSSVNYPVDLAYALNANASTSRIDVTIAPSFSGGAAGDFLCLIDNQVVKVSAGSSAVIAINGTFDNAPANSFLDFDNVFGHEYRFQFLYNVDKENPSLPGNDFGLLIREIRKGGVLVVR